MDDTLPTRRDLGRRVPALAILVAACVTGCANSYYGTTAASYMRRAREDPDPNKRFVVYHKLSEPECYDSQEQKDEASQLLISKLEEGREPVASRAVICRTLGELHRPIAREAVIKAVSDPEGLVRTQACRALGKVGQPEDATILSRVMIVDTLEDCRIAAIEGLGELKSQDLRILEVLVSGMEHDDPAIRLASLKSLRAITREDLGVEPGPWRKHLQKLVASKSNTASTAPTASTTPAASTTSNASKPPAVSSAPPADASTTSVGTTPPAATSAPAPRRR